MSDKTSESATFEPWDGVPRTGKCDHIGCKKLAVLHLEMSSPGSPYAAESDLCADHLPAVEEQVRAFLVAVCVIEPTTNTERNIKVAAEEHL